MKCFPSVGTSVIIELLPTGSSSTSRSKCRSRLLPLLWQLLADLRTGTICVPVEDTNALASSLWFFLPKTFLGQMFWPNVLIWLPQALVDLVLKFIDWTCDISQLFTLKKMHNYKDDQLLPQILGFIIVHFFQCEKLRYIASSVNKFENQINECLWQPD